MNAEVSSTWRRETWLQAMRMRLRARWQRRGVLLVVNGVNIHHSVVPGDTLTLRDFGTGKTVVVIEVR